MNELEWLEKWYESRCDGKWEHEQRIRIDGTDNPGWWVKICVSKEGGATHGDTVLAVEGEPPSAANGNIGGSEWMVCQIQKGVFHGAGDPSKLRTIVRCFRDLVEGPGPRPRPRVIADGNDDR